MQRRHGVKGNFNKSLIEPSLDKRWNRQAISPINTTEANLHNLNLSRYKCLGVFIYARTHAPYDNKELYCMIVEPRVPYFLF